MHPRVSRSVPTADGERWTSLGLTQLPAGLMLMSERARECPRESERRSVLLVLSDMLHLQSCVIRTSNVNQEKTIVSSTRKLESN